VGSRRNAAMKDGTSRCSNATVSRALSASGCTVLLNNEKSAEIARIPVSAARPDNTLHLFNARVRE